MHSIFGDMKANYIVVYWPRVEGTQAISPLKLCVRITVYGCINAKEVTLDECLWSFSLIQVIVSKEGYIQD